MKLLISIIFAVTLTFPAFSQVNTYVQTSKDFLTALKNNENTDNFKDKYASFTIVELSEGLKTNEERLAFWINTYNAFIQRKLKANPELYENRGAFFKNKFINIGGRMVAFADIEHGIIRRSQFEYFLGYVTNPFAGSWERKLRVKKRDYRIHFALNCGAKSCPPVGIYDNRYLDEQLNSSSKQFLNKFTEVTDNSIKSTSLFSWFRGDFGGKKGAKTILVNFDIIKESDKSKSFDLSYDWTLLLDNYVEF
jgi:hypothetical protein